MKTNDCWYSYGNVVGRWLQLPYYKMASQTVDRVIFSGFDKMTDNGRRIRSINTENSVQKSGYSTIQQVIFIAKHIFYFVVRYFAKKVLLPLWFLGKIIVRCSHMCINRENLARGPAPLLLPECNATSHEKAAKIEAFFCRYQGEYQPSLDEVRKKGISVVQQLLVDACLGRPSVPEIEADNPIPLRKRKLALGQLTSYVMAIEQKMEEPNFSPDRERDILLEFARSTTVCYATWIEVASTIFTDLYTPGVVVQNQILRYVQKYKEELLTSLVQQEFQLENWHLIGVHRRLVGEELGLDITNKEDPDADMMAGVWNLSMALLSLFSKNQDVQAKSKLVWAFLQRYEDVNGVLSGIAAIINNEASMDFMKVIPPLKDYLRAIVVKKKIVEEGAADEYVAQHYFTEDCMTINEPGVSLMLRELNIIC